MRPDQRVLTATACICIAIFSQREVFGDFYFYTGISRGKRSLDMHGHCSLHTRHVIHDICPNFQDEALRPIAQTNTGIRYLHRQAFPYILSMSPVHISGILADRLSPVLNR